MTPEGTSVAESDPIMQRLEDQIAWYDRKSQVNQRWYKRIKTTEIVAAALIPLLVTFHAASAHLYITGGLGVFIVFSELILHINEYHEKWKTYRSACEGLKREKYLYLAKAGPYASIAEPREVLAERRESIAYQEHAKWSSVPEKPGREGR